MLMLVLQAAGALAALFLGGELLVRGATALALRFGISQLAVGLTVVAFGTSTPELIVSLDAAVGGASDIAVGNVVGSNIANVALILGLGAVIHPIAVHTKVVRVDAPLVLITALALVATLIDGTASRGEGVVLMLGLAAFVMYTLVQARQEAQSTLSDFASPAGPSERVALVSVALVAIGLGVLVVAGHVLVGTAIRLATSFGVPEATVGLTIVAVGTSLPELVTTVVASLRGRGDLAIGNVIGSNVFNVLGIVGVTAVVHPLDRGGVTWLDLGVMAALSIALLPMMFTRFRLERWEGAVLLGVFVLYTIVLLAGMPS